MKSQKEIEEKLNECKDILGRDLLSKVMSRERTGYYYTLNGFIKGLEWTLENKWTLRKENIKKVIEFIQQLNDPESVEDYIERIRQSAIERLEENEE